MKINSNLNVEIWNFLRSMSFNRFVFRVLNLNNEKHHLIKEFLPFLDAKTSVLWNLGMECLGNVVLEKNRKY